MIINHSIFDEPITLSNLDVIVIEDINTFTSFVLSFFGYENSIGEIKLFNSDYSDLKSTEIIVVTDFINYNLNNKSILNQVYSEIEEQVNLNPETKSAIEKHSEKISDLIMYEAVEHELNLTFEKITIQHLLNVIKLKIELDDKSALDKLLSIVQSLKYLKNKKLLVLINSAAFFTNDELLELSDYVSMINTNVLMVEPRELNAQIKQYIIDKDYFMTVKG